MDIRDLLHPLEKTIEPDTLGAMKYVERITFNPSQCGGRPCIRGMRIRVKDVLDLLAAGVGEPEILRDFPYIQTEDIRACLEYAAGEVDHPVLVALGSNTACNLLSPCVASLKSLNYSHECDCHA